MLVRVLAMRMEASPPVTQPLHDCPDCRCAEAWIPMEPASDDLVDSAPLGDLLHDFSTSPARTITCSGCGETFPEDDTDHSHANTVEAQQWVWPSDVHAEGTYMPYEAPARSEGSVGDAAGVSDVGHCRTQEKTDAD